MKIGVIGIDGMEVTLAANGAATATAHLWERRKSRQDFSPVLPDVATSVAPTSHFLFGLHPHAGCPGASGTQPW